MSELTIKINLDNDALQEDYAAAELLREVADLIQDGAYGDGEGDDAPIRDSNGNTVGRWSMNRD